MDLQEFEKNYGTEEQCLDHLFKLRWKYGYRCPRCNYDEMWEIKDYKYKCKKCSYQTTVIAGTLFQDTHLPLTTWFRAIWFLSEQTNVTAPMLKKELGLINDRTALKMLNKLNRTKVIPTLNKLHGTIEVSRHFIKVCNKSVWLGIAIEITDKKIGCVRLSEIENTPESFEKFINDVVEENSSLVCKENINFEGYSKDKRAYTYEFPYAKKLMLKLNSWLCNSTSAKTHLDNCFNEFCSLFNSRKTKISFEEILENAVNLQPFPSIDPLFKSI